MELYVFEKGFNYSQDGPGNRLVYHLMGCNMFCPWCSNPEGMTLNKEKSVKTEDIISEIISAKSMFFEGGGVTFTGGECSLQAPPLIEVIKELKRKNISVAIESNAATRGFLQLALLCDFIMVDFKNPKGEILSKITGGNLDLIKENIREILKHKELHIRIPLIHNFNDSEDDLKGFVEFFETLTQTGGKFDVEILPYHEYGKEKWQKAGLEYKVISGFVSEKTVEEFKSAFKEAGINIINT